MGAVACRLTLSLPLHRIWYLGKTFDALQVDTELLRKAKRRRASATQSWTLSPRHTIGCAFLSQLLVPAYR